MKSFLLSSGKWRSHAVFGLGCALLATVPTRAQVNQLDVGVRSTVVDKPTSKSDLQKAKPHGKVYGIVSVQHVTGEGKLIKPVDEGMIMQVLSEELNANGFRLYKPGENPEILLTVYYGRGFVANPYAESGGRTETPAQGGSSAVSGGANGSLAPAPTLSVTGVPTSLMKGLEPGYEQKRQKARYEKLYIRVSAWQYPTDPKAHVKQLWNATMVVDDPEHRDLNAVAAKMLAAGAPYFDKEIAEEVDVYKPLPEGHVKVGTPEVVGSQVK
jgi:hypothetical protein